LLVPLFACMLNACEKVHEFPEEGKEVDPTQLQIRVKIQCDVKISSFDIVTKASDPISPEAELSSDYQRRFLVEIRENEYSNDLVESHTILRDVEDVSPLIVETKLHAKKYKLVVWMDYVKKGSTDDLFYLTSNGKALNAIHLPTADKYVACSEFKDAQNYVSDMDLTPYAGEWFADVTIPAPLARPVAKITLLASDLADYAASVGYVGSLSQLAENMVLEVSYDGYLPTGFNALTGRLNDASSGYGYKSGASYPYTLEDVDFTRIGFDYIFVNNDKSSVTISVKIKTKSGQYINDVGSIVVPITRGRETVLIYKFFTKECAPGIGIDPGFDGEINVYV